MCKHPVSSLRYVSVQGLFHDVQFLLKTHTWEILPVPKPAGSQGPFPGSLYSETKHSLALALAASYSELPTEICVCPLSLDTKVMFPAHLSLFNTTFTRHLPLLGWS